MNGRAFLFYGEENLKALEQNRLKQLEEIIERGKKTFVEVGLALLEIRDKRLYKESHSSFDSYCRERWGYSRQYGHQLMAAAEVSSMLDISNPRQAYELAPLVKADEQEAVKIWRDLKEEYGDKVTAGLIRRTVKNRIERIKREEGRKAPSDIEPPRNTSYRIDNIDFREIEIASGSVDLILTDPPYPKEFIPLWSDLSKFAARILKPGRLLIAYAGQTWLPEYIKGLSESLTYHWCGSVVTEGRHTVIHGRKVWTRSKPLLIFSNGKYNGPWIEDTIYSPGAEKEGHEWQQSERPAREIIEKLTGPGDLIVEPFLGSGTTILAATKAGRRSIGCDVDKNAVNIALGRLQNEPL